ncbi:MAG: C40 family peptidase [Firmicutes bacterium]|nr:C40 family peptidase [Bacillota bacterium]
MTCWLRRRTDAASGAALVVVLMAAMPAAASAAEAGAVETVSAQQALAALEEALRYVEAGVPYQLGGKITLEEYLALKEEDPEAAAARGVDASGVVVNAYRAALPDLTLFAGPPEQGRTTTYVTSEALFRYNTVPVPLEQAQPGDLLFFRSPGGDSITGVGVVSAVSGRIIRVVVASASRGRVVDIGIDTQGDYWARNVAGLGRLIYHAGAATPATAAP